MPKASTLFLVNVTNFVRSLNFNVVKCFLEQFVIFISVINQTDAQNFFFTVSLFHASTCFEHMCLSSGGQNT